MRSVSARPPCLISVALPAPRSAGQDRGVSVVPRAHRSDRLAQRRWTVLRDADRGGAAGPPRDEPSIDSLVLVDHPVGREARQGRLADDAAVERCRQVDREPGFAEVVDQEARAVLLDDLGQRPGTAPGFRISFA